MSRSLELESISAKQTADARLALGQTELKAAVIGCMVLGAVL